MKQCSFAGYASGSVLELEAFYFAGAVAVGLLRAGKYSVGGPIGKWN